MSQSADVPADPPGNSPSVSRGGRGLLSAIKSMWRRGEPVDARAALSRNPKLKAEKSVVLDLAYEEYCLRDETGQPPDPDEFCERFPTYKASLRRLIEAHRLLEDNSYLLAGGQPVRWPEPGETFLGYRLVSELGRGAFARVFLATEPALGNRQVAIKVSLQGASEAETLGRLNHPNIVPVHSVREEQPSGLTVVCMPYLGSATLCDVLDKASTVDARSSRARTILDAVQEIAPAAETSVAIQPDPRLTRGSYIDGIIHIGAQLADALACIHGRGICHLDLKPSNVLMTPDGRPMLLDFNLAFDRQINDNRLGGTLPYMSPEQLQAIGSGDIEASSGVRASSDLYSLGVILYELLTGTHPFGPIPLKLPPKEIREILLKRQQGGPRPIRELNPAVDKGLARTIERCLAFDLKGRPESAAVVVGDLRRSLSAHRRLRRWSINHPVLATTLVIAALAAGSAGTYALVTREPYALRHFHAGLRAYADEDYQRAVTELTLAVQADDSNPDAWFTRGKAHQAKQEFPEALSDYDRSNKLRLDGRTLACMGYCQNHDPLRDPNKAVGFYISAINAGFAPAAVYNNLGYSHYESGKTMAVLANALNALNKAIEIDPNLRTAYYNRYWCDSQKAHSNPAYIPWPAIADIEKTIEMGPPEPVVFLRAASLYSIAGQHDAALRHVFCVCCLPGDFFGNAVRMCTVAHQPRWAKPVLRHMASALDAGLNPQHFRSLVYVQFRNDPVFQALLQKERPASVLHPDLARVIDPADLSD
jgi:serine/threonine protein kinase/Tfp pilus assembly protein PilF